MASGSVRKRKYANGSEVWIADYRDHLHKRHIKSFDTQRKAKEWLHKTIGEVRDGTHTPERQSINLWDAAERWLQHCRAEKLEPVTLRYYEMTLRHIFPKQTGAHSPRSLAAVKLANLNQAFLMGWRDDLLLRPKMSRDLARRVLSTLKTILKYAQTHGLIAQNPAQLVTVSEKTREEERLLVGISVPTPEQLAQLLAAANGTRFFALLKTAIYTGMRAGELRGLVWSAVDLDGKVIHVRQRADERGRIGPPKSKAGRRSIPISEDLVNTLRGWQKECPAGPLNLVCPNTLGNVEQLSVISDRFFRPLQRRLGIANANGQPFNFHMLRHAAAWRWIKAGFAPKRLQQLMGHSTISMTFDRYGGWYEDPLDDQTKLAQAEAALKLA